MANTYITRTPSSAGNRRKFTISMWVKRVKLGVDQWLVQAGASGSEFDIRFTTSDQIRFSTWDGSNGYGMITTRVFRDVSAWYHLVFQYDTAQATDTNRNKIYVNGEQISPSDTSAYNAGKHPPQNYDNPSWNNTTAFRINDVTWTSSSPKDAVYSHIHHTDGYAYDASTFGSTDATTGEWKINTSPSITMGTNGFTILKDGNTITDQSSNSNNFTLGGGTLTKTEDCPSNVFATFNRLTRHGQNTNNNGDLLENGNTVFNTPSSTDSMKGFVLSTLGMNSGKYYCEIKVKAGIRLGVGICNMNVFNTTSVPYDTTNQSMLSYSPNSGNINYDGDSTYATGVTATENDILGFALDMDNNHWYIHKNGNYFNSGNPASGSTGTGSIISNITNGANYFNHDEMFFFASDFSTSGYARAEFNFGNGFFGTTAISSEGTNASGIGKFEYDVPAGYTALSTKGLNL